MSISVSKKEKLFPLYAIWRWKSTLLRCLIGLEEIDSGDVKVPDKKKMGMVFQSFNLFPHKTAIQNIMKFIDSCR